ncbi:MAG: hypothetical protein ACRESS_07120 [Stenotrophobium sp.]
MNHVAFLILPLLLATPLPLLAQQQGIADNRVMLMQQRREQLRQKWEKQFRAADTDHSRTLSHEECIKAGLPAAIIDNFDKIDANHDGVLSPEELMAVYEKRLQVQESTPQAAAQSVPDAISR